jgi:hypothetical protein
MRISVHEASTPELIAVAQNLRQSDRDELSISRDPDDWLALVCDVIGSMECKVATIDSVPVLAFGVRIVGPTTVTVWGFGTERAPEAGRVVTRYVKQRMIPLLRSLGMTRAQCAVSPDNLVSRRWLALLGFTPEASFPGLGNRLLVYARGADE